MRCKWCDCEVKEVGSFERNLTMYRGQSWVTGDLFYTVIVYECKSCGIRFQVKSEDKSNEEEQ